ncbi:MAG: GntR family transcriptional regulator [Erysipelotrichaceae bacterium]|nr:GntR family transcriptional regulator [Erysipelotrichaceae bacterium]
MSWKFESGIPIYSQIMDIIKLRILSGIYTPGGKLPGVRDLALEAGVNPNTMQRAMAGLENEGLVRSVRTSGRYITDDEDLINVLRMELSRTKVEQFYHDMKAIGLTQEEVISLVLSYGGMKK